MWYLKVLLIVGFYVPLAFCSEKEGKTLFDSGSCLECHNHEDFGDEKSKIKMFEQLEARVHACQLAGDDGLFDDEVHSISKYLNKDFYKLEK